MSDRDNITLPREVVEDVLYALVSEQNHGGDDCYADSITALRTALAAEQPKPEPVAWMRKEWSPDCGTYFDFYAEEEMGWRDRKEWTPLYTAPPDAEALRRDAELGRWIREETPPIEEIAARVDAMEDKT